LKALLDQHENPGIHVMIGAGRSSTCQTVAIGAAVYNIPCISYACTAIALSDKLTYPFFNRVVPPGMKKKNAQEKANWSLTSFLITYLTHA
jgi:hypothetical protein